MTADLTRPYFILTGIYSVPGIYSEPGQLPPRELLFGDYDRDAVEQESFEYTYDAGYVALRIDRLDDDKQATIDAKVAT